MRRMLPTAMLLIGISLPGSAWAQPAVTSEILQKALERTGMKGIRAAP